MAKNKSIFTTSDDEQTAKRLGFKVGRSEEIKVENFTYVVGYFNPHPWPVHIMISELGGISVTLNQKEDYVLDVEGRKINDPILDKYVNSTGLAREMSKEKMPILRIPRQADETSERPPVQEAEGFSRGAAGQTVPLIKSNVKIIPKDNTPQLPPPGKSPVLGMTIEMARKLGLVKPTREVMESDVKDTEGIPPSGQDIPEIQYAVDMTPSQAKKALNPNLVKPETQEQAAVVEQLNSAADMSNITDVSKVFKLTDSSSPNIPETGNPDPVEADVKDDSRDDTETKPIEDDSRDDTETKPIEADSDLKFVCAADGKRFKFRSGLERYVRRKHTSKYDVLMAPYPKSK